MILQRTTKSIFTPNKFTSVFYYHFRNKNGQNIKSVNKLFSSSISRKCINCDICIVGGGPAGLSLAAALINDPQMKDQNIVLIDSGSLKQKILTENHFSNRVSSLTPSSAKFLQGISVWDHIPSNRIFPYNQMKVWQSKYPGAVHFNAYEAGLSSIAHIVENQVLVNALLDSIFDFKSKYEKNQTSNIELLTDTKLEKIDRDDESGWPVVYSSQGHEIKSRVLIGADGLRSHVRSFAKIQDYGWDYRQKGVVATLELEPNSRNEIAWQRFLPGGPIAILPLAPGFASLVWTLNQNDADKVLRMEYTQLTELLNIALFNAPEDTEYIIQNINKDGHSSVDIREEGEWGRERLQRQQPVNTDNNCNDSISVPEPSRILSIKENSVAGFPLRLRNCERYIDDRIVLVGDAAHTIHPLAGQGLNLGLGDVECLAKVLSEAVYLGQDYGRDYVLEQYARKRFPADVAMLAGVDSIWRAFTTNNATFGRIRGLGLDLVQSSPFLKNMFMKIAS